MALDSLPPPVPIMADNDALPPRVAPPRPSILPRASLAPLSSRRRRRSSARFLSSRRSSLQRSRTNLNELYTQAIRLNAENRINTGNSWNLHLIDHIDEFLNDDNDDDDNNNTDEKRVNFTKASCTLDASVKIYSYRVDDVHLTSYKVLAGLHRNDNHKETDDNDDDVGGDETQTTTTKTRKSSKPSGPTLETNHANIDMNRLEAAFDIDPLFSKMSQAFDEGGAKGLLLVNLSTGPSCNIVFDSQLDTEEEEPTTPAREQGDCNISRLTEGLHDIERLALVPQLASLREEQASLAAEGFVADATPGKRHRRYAADEEEEQAADKSIHQEALERSQASALGRSMLEEDDDDGYAAPDFGDDDDDDDVVFDNFMAGDEEGGRYSSVSFGDAAPSPILQDPGVTSTAMMLTAIVDQPALLIASDYQYLDTQALQKNLAADNVWAGASHWKKRTAPKKKEAPKKKASRKKIKTTLDLQTPPDLAELLAKKPKKSLLQWSKAVVDKHAATHHLLPMDAGMGVDALSKLFLQPNAVLKPETTTSSSAKTVGFDMCVETFDDGSFGGDDDDDGGFVLHDDYTPVLQDVRTVEKVRVQYATIAKKVDVKRLKRDLWLELQAKFAQDDCDDEEEAPPMTPKPTGWTFQQAVQDLESHKTQADVTLPFYFICILHLANEKGLRLESSGLDDFTIHQDETIEGPSF